MEEKIQQYLEGKLTEDEQLELLRWLKGDGNQAIFNHTKANWWKNKSTGWDGIGQSRLAERLAEKKKLGRTQRQLSIYRYAAVFLLMASIAAAMYISRQHLVNPTLQYTEIHTDFGQVSGMTLPDGTEVWINAGTKLLYNNQYGTSNRDIKVNGEAYFSVSKNKKIPFVVDMGLMKVEVTGTSFGVSNYDDSNTMNVVLEEGSVNVHSANNKLLVTLKPEEMALFNKSEMTLETRKVKPRNYTSWKDGVIHIFELPLGQLVEKLEKRYNQKFEVEPAVREFPYTMSIEGESLSEIINLIERISPVKAVQQGDIIKLKYEPLNH